MAAARLASSRSKGGTVALMPMDASAASRRWISARLGSLRAAAACATGRSSATSTRPPRSSARRDAASRTGPSTSPSRYGSVLPDGSPRQYESLRRNVRRPPRARGGSRAANGPVPDAPRAIAAWGAPRCARNGPNAVCRSKRIVRASPASVRAMTGGSPKSSRYRDGRPRSKLATTADASSDEPSWKRTPSRSVKVQLAASFEACHDDARPGPIFPVAASTVTSVSNIWRVATSDGSSAFHGSSDVTSPGIATRTMPPVCAPLGAGVAVAGTFWQERSDATTRPSAADLSRGIGLVRLQAGIEGVTQAVADEIEAQHREEHHQAGRNDEPPGTKEVRSGIGEHVAPARSRRHYSEAQIAERRLGEDDRSDIDCE